MLGDNHPANGEPEPAAGTILPTGDVWIENTEVGPMFFFALPSHSNELGQSLDTSLEEDLLSVEFL